jgi:hypothetical protein
VWLKEHTETWEKTMHEYVQDRLGVVTVKLTDYIRDNCVHLPEDGQAATEDDVEDNTPAQTTVKTPKKPAPKTPKKTPAEAASTNDPFGSKSAPSKPNPFEGFTRSLINDKAAAAKIREKPEQPAPKSAKASARTRKVLASDTEDEPRAIETPSRPSNKTSKSAKPSSRKRKVAASDTEDEPSAIETPSRPSKKAKATPAPRAAKTPASKTKATPRKRKATTGEDSDASIDLSKYK